MSWLDSAGRAPSPTVVLPILARPSLAACGTTVPGGKHVTTPTPVTVIGKAPKPPAAVVGDPAAGKAVFVSSGCGACHTFTPAGTTGKIGPNLDNLADYAKAANQGSLEDFVHESIVDPGAYVAPGYSNVMPSRHMALLR